MRKQYNCLCAILLLFFICFISYCYYIKNSDIVYSWSSNKCLVLILFCIHKIRKNKEFLFVLFFFYCFWLKKINMKRINSEKSSAILWKDVFENVGNSLQIFWILVSSFFTFFSFNFFFLWWFDCFSSQSKRFYSSFWVVLLYFLYA